MALAFGVWAFRILEIESALGPAPECAWASELAWPMQSQVSVVFQRQKPQPPAESLILGMAS